jgi:hypothetical protein
MRRVLLPIVFVLLSAGCAAQAALPVATKPAGSPKAPTPTMSTAGAAFHAIRVGVHPNKPTKRPTPSPTTSSMPTTSAPGGTITKTLVVFIENHTLIQMRAGMPYLNSVADRYGYANNYTALTHPSLPNYLAVAGGSTFGINDDLPPAAHPLSGPSVFGQAIAAGKTAKVYAEDEPGNCAPWNSGLYAVRHTGWPYFADEAASCKLYDVPSGTADSGAFKADVAAGNLPNVGWLIPNLCNDAHLSGCPLQDAGSLSLADNWLSKMLPVVFNGPDFKSGTLAVVVTADEGSSGSNQILTVVANPAMSGVVVTTALNHYSLSGFLSQMSGSAPLRNAAGAPSFAAAFGLTTP